MALIAAQAVSLAGLTPSFAAAANTDTVAADGRTALWVKNGSGGSINVTVITTATVGGLAVADLVVAVSAGAEKIIGPFPRSLFGNAQNQADIDYSSITTVTRAAVTI